MFKLAQFKTVWCSLVKLFVAGYSYLLKHTLLFFFIKHSIFLYSITILQTVHMCLLIYVVHIVMRINIQCTNS